MADLRGSILSWLGGSGDSHRADRWYLQVTLCAVAACAAGALAATPAGGPASQPATQPASRPAPQAASAPAEPSDTWRERERQEFLLALTLHDGARLPARSPSALLAMLEDKDPDMRHFAAAQLGLVQPPDGDVIDALVRCLGDDSTKVRLAAAESLVKSLSDPNCQAADLSECLRNTPETINAAAAAISWAPGALKKPLSDALVRVGRPAKEVLVRQVLAGGDPATLVPLAERIDPNAMAPVLDVLRGKDLLAAIDAAHALSYSRRFGRPAALILADQLGSGGLRARLQAGEDLLRLGPLAVDALLTLSRGPSAMARMLAMQTLGGIGRAGGKDAEAGVLRGLKDSDPGVRRAAAAALVAVSDTPAPAALVLAEDLKSPIPQLRLEAAERLGRIGPVAGAEVAQALADCLRDEHWAVRLGAARALERIAPSAASVAGVAEALKAATKDSDADVRAAAAVALVAIEKAKR